MPSSSPSSCSISEVLLTASSGSSSLLIHMLMTLLIQPKALLALGSSCSKSTLSIKSWNGYMGMNFLVTMKTTKVRMPVAQHTPY